MANKPFTQSFSVGESVAQWMGTNVTKGGFGIEGKAVVALVFRHTHKLKLDLLKHPITKSDAPDKTKEARNGDRWWQAQQANKAGALGYWYEARLQHFDVVFVGMLSRSLDHCLFEWSERRVYVLTSSHSKLQPYKLWRPSTLRTWAKSTTYRSFFISSVRNTFEHSFLKRTWQTLILADLLVSPLRTICSP